MEGIITSVSGRLISIHNPQPKDFIITDIAQGLANTCRFSGQIRYFYSVAQHSVEVARSLMIDHNNNLLAMQGLFHDAAEAYLHDISSPLKAELVEYRKIEEYWMKAIAKKFNLPWPFSSFVKKADVAAYDWEKIHVKENKECVGVSPDEAYRQFMDFYETFKEIGSYQGPGGERSPKVQETTR